MLDVAHKVTHIVLVGTLLKETQMGKVGIIQVVSRVTYGEIRLGGKGHSMPF